MIKWDQGYIYVANWIEKKMKGKEDQIDNYTHTQFNSNQRERAR